MAQIKYLIYCLENAIWNSDSNQGQMVWLIDFQGWNTSCLSMKVARDTAQILQAHYPERLGIAIFYNPPKMFESFWMVWHHNISCLHHCLLFIGKGGVRILWDETWICNDILLLVLFVIRRENIFLICLTFLWCFRYLCCKNLKILHETRFLKEKINL